MQHAPAAERVEWSLFGRCRALRCQEILTLAAHAANSLRFVLPGPLHERQWNGARAAGGQVSLNDGALYVNMHATPAADAAHSGIHFSGLLQSRRDGRRGGRRRDGICRCGLWRAQLLRMLRRNSLGPAGCHAAQAGSEEQGAGVCAREARPGVGGEQIPRFPLKQLKGLGGAQQRFFERPSPVSFAQHLSGSACYTRSSNQMAALEPIPEFVVADVLEAQPVPQLMPAFDAQAMVDSVRAAVKRTILHGVSPANLVAILTVAMETVEKFRGASGAQKKDVVLAVMDLLVQELPEGAQRELVRAALDALGPSVVDALVAAANGKFSFKPAREAVVACCDSCPQWARCC